MAADKMTILDQQRRPVLRMIKIKDGNAYLNADKNLPIPLSHQWKVGDLLPLVMAYCSEYDIEPVSEKHVQTIINRAVLDNDKGKVHDLVLDEKASDADKRAFMVQEVMTRLTLRTLEDTGEILYYVDDIYKPGGKEKILAELQLIGGFEITNSMRNEVVATIKALTYTPREAFDSDPNLVHLNNGWLDLATGKFMEDAADRFSLKKCGADYDPEADCPAIKKFLGEVLEKEDLDVVKKLIGYLLLPHNKYKKAFMLIGPKDTGKSTFLALLEAFVGSASHVSLHDLARRSHNVVKAAYSMLNTTSEVPAYALKDVSLFKNWTGNDEITVREIYQPPFDARITAKFILATNDPPNFEQADRTFIDRWVVLEFNNIFEGGAQDIDIIDKLTAPSELSGLLNMALKGLKMLKRDGYFKDETYDEIESRWKMMTSKIGGYLAECTVQEDSARILGDDLYEDYCNYCAEKRETPMHRVHFGRELQKAGYQHKQMKEGKHRPWFYLGLTIKGGRKKPSEQEKLI